MSDLDELRALYLAWDERRKRLMTIEGLTGLLDDDDIAASDDEAVDLLRALAAALWPA